MIENIIINGFRSLNGFSITFKKGMNILVGPNGAGKSNIVSFFEFLSFLVQRELPEAVSLAGGAGNLFTKISASDFVNNIDVKINGSTISDNNKYLYYQYTFNIEVSTSKGLINYKKQSFKLLFADERLVSKNIDFETLDWHVDIEQKLNEDLSPFFIVNKIDGRRLRLGMYLNSYSKKNVERYLFHDYQRFGSRSLIQFLNREADNFSKVYRDFQVGQSFNIEPSKIKMQEDIAKPFGINADGSGLSATLFALKNVRKYSDNIAMRRMPSPARMFPSTLFNEIIALTKLANPAIDNIDVINNTFDNQLIVKISIATEKGKITLPLSYMSDGTLKWLTLITAILTSQKVISIEEPENFLHPWMQKEIMDIIRNKYESKHDSSFLILSTHSETLLNNATSEEIIVISMTNGITSAKRIKNRKLLNAEIQKTGFGLGYYYLAGALND